MPDAPASPLLQPWNVCVAHTPQHAGLYRGIEDFARALGGRVVSFDDARSPPAHPSENDSTVRIPCAGSSLHRHCHLLSRSAAHAADHVVANADLLIAHSMFRAHCGWTRQWAARLGRGYWAVPHGCLDPRGMAHRAALKRLWMWRHGTAYLRDADRVIFATRRERDKAARWLTTPRAVVVPWPVPVPDLSNRNDARIAVRHRLGIPGDDHILLFVGRLHSTKRPLETIAAFCSANPDGCHLVIVGMDGDLTAARARATVPAEFQGRVHVVGELSGAALTEMWLAGDGYISLSMKENFGYSAAEAVAYGLPVILSPGHDLAFEMPTAAGRLACGWLLPDDTAASARQAIVEFSHSLRQSESPASAAYAMRKTGRQWVADQLSFDLFRDRLRSLAEDTASRHRLPHEERHVRNDWIS